MSSTAPLFGVATVEAGRLRLPPGVEDCAALRTTVLDPRWAELTSDLDDPGFGTPDLHVDGRRRFYLGERMLHPRFAVAEGDQVLVIAFHRTVAPDSTPARLVDVVLVPCRAITFPLVLRRPETALVAPGRPTATTSTKDNR